MKLFGFQITFPWETKIAPDAALLARAYTGGSTWGVAPKRNMAQYFSEAYGRNVVAYKCVNTISKSAASIDLKVKVGDKEADESHPLCVLLKRPNPTCSKEQFVEAMVAFYLLTGNIYVHGVGPDGEPPMELWTLRSDRMRVLPSDKGVGGYMYELNGGQVRWDADPVTGYSEICHIKSFNPLDDWYGMSCVEAASYGVDQHNVAGQWNAALLQNMGRPSGALTYAPSNGGTLSDKQYERLKEEISANYQGAKNAGRPLILDGGLDWKSIQMSPVEMDWLNGKNNSSREICMAFNVPPMILGIPGDNTYSNYQEARQSLFEDTVIPTLGIIIGSLNHWLCPAYGDDVKIEMCFKNHPAMAVKREKQWNAVQNASWLTINEKREATGFDPLPVPEADEIWMPSGLAPLTGALDAAETGREAAANMTEGSEPEPSKEEVEAEEAQKSMDAIMSKILRGLEKT